MRTTLRALAAALLVLTVGAAPGYAEAKGKKSSKSEAKPKAEPAKEKAEARPPEPAPKPAKGGAAEGADPDAIRRGERVEFDERLIQGQTAKAGAVYLFERMSSDLRSMVKERRSYREEVVETVFPSEEKKD